MKGNLARAGVVVTTLSKRNGTSHLETLSN